MKKILIVLFLLLAGFSYAQKKGYMSAGVYFESGTRGVPFGAMAAHFSYNPIDNVILSATVYGSVQQPVTMDETTFMPAARLKMTTVFPLKASVIALEQSGWMRNFGYFDIREWNMQTLVSWQNPHWSIGLGLHDRLIRDLNSGIFDPSEPYVNEPFNLIYRLQYRLALEGKRWYATFRVTNFDYLFTDYYYNPGLGAGFNYILSKGPVLWADLYFHPSGIFNLSPVFYESTLKLGATWNIY